MFKSKKLIVIGLSLGLLSGCAANTLQPGAQSVEISMHKAGKRCKYLGTVTANQGNFFTGEFTSNAHLQEGAFNDLRNKAATLGGNFIEVVANQAGTTAGGDFRTGYSSSQSNYTSTGSVFYCPR